MPNIPTNEALRFVTRGINNLYRKRPLAFSLEITHSCNCNCKHCDKGHIIPNEILAPPAKFGKLVGELKPLVAQISGGEPLLREDVFDIVREITKQGIRPYIVFCTNAWLLNKEKYLKLKESGVNEISISLDYPDERHDENRGINGLYRHLNNLIPQLTKQGNKDITLISVIRSENLQDLIHLAEHAIKWDTSIVFSAYTNLRTGDKSHSVQGDSQLKLLRKQIDSLIQFKREKGYIFTSEYVLNSYYNFFANDSYRPNCQAGYRSLVINPDGKLAPCAMIPKSYDTREELIEQFSKHNPCGGCYVSLRANTERSLKTLIIDSWQTFRQGRTRFDN